MSTVRKVPLRKCIGCNEMKNKKEMIRVVKSGTGKRAALDNGYTVAGKTGSAEASNDKSIESHAWFVGYITNDNAPYAILSLIHI